MTKNRFEVDQSKKEGERERERERAFEKVLTVWWAREKSLLKSYWIDPAPIENWSSQADSNLIFVTFSIGWATGSIDRKFGKNSFLKNRAF